MGHIQINAPDYNEEHADVLPDEPARAHLDPLGLDGGPKSLLATHLARQFNSNEQTLVSFLEDLEMHLFYRKSFVIANLHKKFTIFFYKAPL